MTQDEAIRAAYLNDSMFQLSELMKLHAIFQTRGALSEKQFVAHFRSILETDSWTPTQISQLFMKIDANSDGSIDWDEFTNFMFVHSQSAMDAAAQLASVAFVPVDNYNEDEPPVGTLRMRDMIMALRPLPKCGQYVTCNMGGTVTTWSSSLELLSSFSALQESKLHSVTAMVYLEKCAKVALTSVYSGVVFFDLISADKKPQAKVPSSILAHASPLSLATTVDEDTGQDILFIGDDIGTITRIDLLPEWHMCDGDFACHDKKTIRAIRHTSTKRHEDHVTRLEVVSDLNSIVSASRDGSIKVVDMHRGVLKRNFSVHRGAVYDFVWCTGPKFFASCGVEREILLWSPFSDSLVGRLHGHTCSIKSVVWNNDGRNLISLGLNDGTIRVWDVRQFKCLQTIHDTSHENQHTRFIYFNPESKNLLTCSSMINIWPMHHAAGATETLQPHEQAIDKVLFNASFDQLVTIDTDGHIVLWSLVDGCVISHFFMSNTTITAAALDDTGRRLITGSNIGTQVDLWNFSNGSRLATLLKRRHNYENEHHRIRPSTSHMNTQPPRMAKQVVKSNEVTGVAHITASQPHTGGHGFSQTKHILSVGWDRRIYVWLDNGSDEYMIRMPENVAKGHSDDILAVVFCPPKLIATGGNDGNVFIWGLNSGDIVGKFHFDSSIETLFYPKNLCLLLAVTSNSSIVFLNPRLIIQHGKIDIKSSFYRGDEIRLAKTDNDGTLLFTALASGIVCVFQIGNLTITPLQIRRLHRWKAHGHAIQSMEYIEATRLLDTFLVTASQTSIKMWTLGGTLVGSFGERTWRMDDAWLRSVKVPLFPERIVVFDAEEKSIHSNAIEMYKREIHVLTQRGPPAVNDVWSRRDTHDTLSNVLTLTSISRCKGTVEGLNVAGQLEEKELHELYDIQDDYATWHREEFLSSLIGHILQENESAVPFKVARVSFDLNGWHLVDTCNEIHPLPSEDDCKEMNYRPYRSLALHVMFPQAMPSYHMARKPSITHPSNITTASHQSIDPLFAGSKYKEHAILHHRRPSILKDMRVNPTKLSAECQTLRLPQVTCDGRKDSPRREKQSRAYERKIHALVEMKQFVSPREKECIFFLPEVDKA